MATGEQILDSPTDWVAKHIRSYVDSEGRQGHHWNGVDTLLLTTRGRHSGALRRTALIYGRDGDRFVVVASNGGSAHHPAWFHNLIADPEVRVQVGPDQFTATARLASPQERPRLWELMAGIWPDYDNYQRKTDREIQVVVLEPR